MDMHTTGRSIYLFCFAHRAGLPLIAGPGVEEHGPIARLEFREVVAVVQEVPLEMFAGPAAEARLQDLAWVGPRACRHEEVVERAMQHSPVLPARFGALFSSPESLKALIEDHYEAIFQFLDYAGDKEEWAVKGLLDREEAQRYRGTAGSQEASPSSSPGRRYLMERRHHVQAVQEVSSWARETDLALATELKRCAADFRRLRPLSQEASGRGREMVFNWAFLVAHRDREVFRSQVEKLSAEQAGRGLVLELSGPWPPYSFCPSLAPREAP